MDCELRKTLLQINVGLISVLYGHNVAGVGATDSSDSLFINFNS
jgi:hypothetical protein